VLCISTLVIIAIMTFVIPKFEAMFKSMNQELPSLTKMVITLSHSIQSTWYLMLFGLITVGVTISQYYKTPDGKRFIDEILLKIPLFGNIIKKASVARFSRTLSTMLASGVGVLEALDIAGKTVGNSVIEETILSARVVVQEGKSMVS